MSEELLEIAFDFDRDLNKLWAVEIATEEMRLSELEWHLDIPFFWQENKPFSLKPRDVFNDPVRYKKWMDKIMNVDISYPIDIIFWKGRWQILDGLHRLCKLYLLEVEFTKVRKIPLESLKLIMPD